MYSFIFSMGQSIIFVDMHSMVEETKSNFTISTDKSKLDVSAIHKYIGGESYWALGIPLDVLKRSIHNSMCFGIYDGAIQIGFARMITDCSTFAYLADVFVLEAYRRKGLSKWLMEFIMKHPELQGLRRYILATKDAHGLYLQYGFKPVSNPENIMEIRNADIYKKEN